MLYVQANTITRESMHAMRIMKKTLKDARDAVSRKKKDKRKAE
jgi:hypothetical protein